MDGIEGEARAGWNHDQILSLFYPGTTSGHASGDIRVGLAEGAVQHFVLPGGGTATGTDVPIKIAPGTRVTVSNKDGRPVVDVQPAAPRENEARRSTVELGAGMTVAEPRSPLQTPPPVQPPPEPSTPPAGRPKPSPSEPTPTPVPARQRHTASRTSTTSLRLTPAGSPAVIKVEATGHQYRGAIDVLSVGRSLRVVNHVDLETYVEGIAEQKGSGWPLEAYKALAVAARSFAASTMTWRGGSHASGFDICPTQSCQVYLGFDGEEASMRRAARETSGKIRTYEGRAILAMYHGNGGGQTESYSRISPTRSNAYPYLKSVRYPYAEPHTWRRELTYGEIRRSLAARGVRTPQRITRLEVLERGDSPRVVRMRVQGNGDEHIDISGTTFMNALDLWSTWFEIGERRELTAVPGSTSSDLSDAHSVAGDVSKSGLVAVLAVAIVALAMATTLRSSDDRLPPSLRVASMAAPPGP
jgi:SpoIID/LytB domain protein